MRISAVLLMLSLVSCTVAHKRGGNVDAVADTFRENSSATQICYKTALTKNPEIGGAVTLAWKVDQTGMAQNARILKSELGDSEMESCLLKQLASMKFPKQPLLAPAFVEYELDFAKGPARAPATPNN